MSAQVRPSPRQYSLKENGTLKWMENKVPNN